MYGCKSRFLLDFEENTLYQKRMNLFQAHFAVSRKMIIRSSQL